MKKQGPTQSIKWSRTRLGAAGSVQRAAVLLCPAGGTRPHGRRQLRWLGCRVRSRVRAGSGRVKRASRCPQWAGRRAARPRAKVGDALCLHALQAPPALLCALVWHLPCKQPQELPVGVFLRQATPDHKGSFFLVGSGPLAAASSACCSAIVQPSKGSGSRSQDGTWRAQLI
jgi:hypothetical protein